MYIKWVSMNNNTVLYNVRGLSCTYGENVGYCSNVRPKLNRPTACWLPSDASTYKKSESEDFASVIYKIINNIIMHVHWRRDKR